MVIVIRVEVSCHYFCNDVVYGNPSPSHFRGKIISKCILESFNDSSCHDIEVPLLDVPANVLLSEESQCRLDVVEVIEIVNYLAEDLDNLVSVRLKLVTFL